MDPGGFERLYTLFSEARLIDSVSRRTAFVLEACGSDAELRDELEQLLERHDETADPGAAGIEERLEAAVRLQAENVFSAEGPESALPERIGPFRVTRRIGIGGMGAVFEAEQERPQRRVALKIIRPDATSPELLRRFEMEALALARLSHPSIARIHELASTEIAGQTVPYIVMELVSGRPLLEHAEEARLGERERIDLLAKICDAVQHAHNKGIIHRDLKPMNIVVESGGRPKVLDFGLARATGASAETRAGHIVGTLPYMSPEQAAADPSEVDTRSDVYALGALGFELLTGRTPHAVRDTPMPVALKRIIEDDARRLDSVDKRFRGDLAHVFAKALERDRDRRYGSAGAFADDLRRYLRDDPVHARALTSTYLLGKFLRRHRTFVVSGALAALALGAATVFAFHSAAEEARQRTIAERSTEAARETAYVSQIQAATAAYHSRDPRTALERLGQTEPSRRGWEFAYLSGRLDLQLGFEPAPADCRPSEHGRTAGSLTVFTSEDDRLWTYDAAADRFGAVRGLDDSAAVVGAIPLAGPDSAVWVQREDGGMRVRRQDDGSFAAAPGSVDPAWAGMYFQAAWGDLAAGRLGEELSASLQVVDLVRRVVIRTIECPGLVSACVFSPDGRRLSVGTVRGSVLAYDVETGREIFRDRRAFSRFTRMTYSPDGRWILGSAPYAQQVLLYDARTGRLVQALPSDRGHPENAAFSEDGAHLATIYRPNELRLSAVSEQGCKPLWIAFAPGPAGVERLLHVGFHAERSEVFTVGQDGRRRWPVAPAPSAFVLGRHGDDPDMERYRYIYAVRYHPGGRLVATGAWDHTIGLWDAATGRKVGALEAEDAEYYRDIAWHPDGRHLFALSRSEDTRVHRFDTRTGAATSAPLDAWKDRLDRPVLAVAPGGGRLAAWAGGGGYVLLDGATLAERTRVEGGTGHTAALAFDERGERLAHGLSTGTIVLRDAEGRAIRRFEGHHGPIQCLRFLRGGRLLLSTCTDGTARAWNVADGTQRSVFDAHGQRVYAAIVFPDEKRVATCGRDSRVRVWDVDTGEELIELRGHEAYVHGLDIDPAGRVLASSSGDGTVRLWDPRPWGEQVRERGRHEALRSSVLPAVEDLFRDHGRDGVFAKIEEARDWTPAQREAAHLVALELGLQR